MNSLTDKAVTNSWMLGTGDPEICSPTHHRS